MEEDLKDTESKENHTGELIGNRYRVHNVKKGGMGQVYLCYDVKSRRPVALKFLQTRFIGDKTLVARFMWEAETWIRLGKHINIVQAYYVDKIDDRPFLCLEYVEGNKHYGSDLKGWITKKGLDFPLSLNFAIQFCSGMEHAESVFNSMKRPFVYRDIKPSNIMVTADKIVKITDFGLVKLAHELESKSSGTVVHGKKTVDTMNGTIKDTLNDKLCDKVNDKVDGKLTDKIIDKVNGKMSDTLLISHQGTIMGTPPYMAPEQWYGDEVDGGIDVYAFGCMFYEMITGEPPFKAATLDEMADLHMHSLPRSIPYAPKKLNEIILKCLEKDRNKRYSNFAEIKDYLQLIYAAITGSRLAIMTEGDSLAAWELVNKGVSLYNLSYYDDSLDCYNKAIEIKSNYPEAYYNRSILYFSLKNYDQALWDCNTAIQLNPDYTEAYYNRGNIYRSLGKMESALKDYDKAINLRPDYAEAYYNRGNIYRAHGNILEAIKDYDRAIDLKPNSYKYLYSRGYAFHSNANFIEAIKNYEAVTVLNPSFPQAFYNLALCLESAEQYEKSMETWDNYLRIAKNDPAQNDWIKNALSHIEKIKKSIVSKTPD
ncbi:MAG: tetratricopeptide repeat protein [Nitrospirae bacterium]|nr:tetratricopeptide repeat protein [Nitrospirota bacterium]